MQQWSFFHKAVSLVVLVAFMTLLLVVPAPARTPSVADATQAGIGPDEEQTPGSFEAEKDTPAAVAKKKKFPWLIVALGAVAVGVAIMLLTRKKTTQPYATLTVVLDVGTEGIPAATTRYKKDEVIAYRYSAKPGFSDLKVTLDGGGVPASGQITMDRDHVLTAATSAVAPTATLTVNSAPAGARIYLDKQDTGFVTPHRFSYAATTTRAVLLRHSCGTQDWAQTVSVALNEETVVNPVLKPGIREDFDIPLSPCWQPRTPSSWSVARGLLAAESPRRGYEFALYDHALPADFVITVRQKIVQSPKQGTIGVIFSVTSDMSDSQGYEFAFTANKKYVIYKNKHYDHYLDRGPWTFIRYDSPCMPMNPGIGAWNVIKIIKSAANYTLYVNDLFVYSFTDDDHKVRYVSLGTFSHLMKVEYDSVLLVPRDTFGSVPGLPAVEIPGAAGGRGGER